MIRFTMFLTFVSPFRRRIYRFSRGSKRTHTLLDFGTLSFGSKGLSCAKKIAEPSSAMCCTNTSLDSRCSHYSLCSRSTQGTVFGILVDNSDGQQLRHDHCCSRRSCSQEEHHKTFPCEVTCPLVSLMTFFATDHGVGFKQSIEALRSMEVVRLVANIPYIK